MLLNKEKKIVIITPMKVGSTTLHDLFDDKPGWATVLGPHPWKMSEIDKHTGCLPQSVIQRRGDFKVLLLIRNPFDRIVSFYKHWCRYHKSSEHTIEYWLEESFTKYCMSTRDNYYNSCSVLYPGYDNVIRIEKLAFDLSKYGIKIDSEEIPHSNKIDNDVVVPQKYHSYIVQQYYTDFVNGGYDFYPRTE